MKFAVLFAAAAVVSGVQLRDDEVDEVSELEEIGVVAEAIEEALTD